MRLRTRLFLTMAIVVAASIIVSGLLSRRATLVEVKDVIMGPRTVGPGFEEIATQVEPAMRVGDMGRLQQILARGERETGRALVLVDNEKRLVAASSSLFTGARVREATTTGELSLELAGGAASGSISVRGAPTRIVRDAGGRALAFLFAVPAPQRPAPPARPAPIWIVTTAATAMMAVVLTFALSRRILRPVTELTVAARRMEAGDLAVRVAAAPAPGDELSELAHAFNSMASQLSETERLRRQMVSDVAHELRSPVTNLRCTLEAIQDGLAAPDEANIAALHEETVFLQRLIADLQDLALAEAGRLQMEMGTVDLADVIGRAAAPLRHGGGLPSIVVDEGSDAGRIRGNADRLEQVFRNLLTNAQRHTPEAGTIHVRVRRDGGMMVIEVSDTGQGIEPEHLPHVFDRFYRADASRTRATGGAGLGLAIVRQFVAAHGGTVNVTSAGRGQGATFVVRLPAVSESGSPASHLRTPEGARDPKPCE